MNLSFHLDVLSRFIVGLFLIVSSTSKIFNFDWFVGALEKYELTPKSATALIAIAVIAAELLCGAPLLIGKWLLWAALGAIALFGVFTCAIAVSMARGRFNIPCGCSGIQKNSKVGWRLISRNLSLVGFSSAAIGNALYTSQMFSACMFSVCVGLAAFSFLPERTCQEIHKASSSPVQPSLQQGSGSV